MDTKEITVLDLAQEQIRNAERLFPLIREKTKVRPEWLSYFKICLKNRERNHLL